MARMSANPNAKYNVMIITNTVTGEAYIGARMGDVDSFFRGASKSAAENWEPTALVQSIRKYGAKNFTRVMLKTGLSYNAAQKMKAGLIAKYAKRGKLLMHQLPRGRGLATNDIPYLYEVESVKLPKKIAKPKVKTVTKVAA